MGIFKNKNNKVAPGEASGSGRDEMSNRLESEKRHCKDLLFLILFIAFWIGMIYVAAIGFVNGKLF